MCLYSFLSALPALSPCTWLPCCDGLYPETTDFSLNLWFVSAFYRNNINEPRVSFKEVEFSRAGAQALTLVLPK